MLIDMFKWTTLMYGLVMALIDTGTLGIVKVISRDGFKSLMLMIIPTLVYAIQPWVFLSAIKNESMTVMNLTWDLLSDILVSTVGIFYFGEKIGFVRTCGLLLGLVSLALLGWKED